MNHLTKATPETSMNEIADRFKASGHLSSQESAELLFNAFRLIRRLENALLKQVEEKRQVDAERMERLAEMKENETHNMRLVRQARDRQQAERERIAAEDGFMDALDAELLKDDAEAVQEPAQPAPVAQQAAVATIRPQVQPTATSAAAAALRAKVGDRSAQRARPAAPTSSSPAAPAPRAVQPKPRGHFTGGMQTNYHRG